MAGIRFAINQHEIGSDMAVSTILPLTGERMVEITLWQPTIGGKKLHRFGQMNIKAVAVPS